jgi:hypothetical protein
VSSSYSISGEGSHDKNEVTIKTTPDDEQQRLVDLLGVAL